MANSNSENPHVGRRFQESVKLILEKKFCTSFEPEAVVAMVCNESLSNVINKEITWLWKPFIPMGKVTLIQGDTGMGKTNILIKLLADLSCGWYPPTLFRGVLQKREQKDPLYFFRWSIGREGRPGS